MFSFKKKDKDKSIETKEERRERRKKEKNNKSERKPHGELGNIVAGTDSDDKSWRFSFRKTDKRRYDIEHDFENANRLAGENRARSDSTDTNGSYNSPSGSAYLISSNNANNSPQPSYVPMEEKSRENEVSEDGKPVPKPRIKRRKSSSIEIKLQNRPRQAAPSNEEKIANGDAVTSVKTMHPDELSIADKNDSVPLKPPRILADKKGVVEFEVKLINVGSEGDKGEPDHSKQQFLDGVDGFIKPKNAEQSYADVPGDFDAPKIVLPPRDLNLTASLSSILSPTEKSLEETGVALKLPEVKPVDSGVARVLKLQRRSDGDFGIALRRANAPGNGKTVHFVEPVGGNNGTAGLLPGDRLVEVNGINVEDESREKIIEMIVLSGEEVVIKVIPVPELSELSVRSGLDGQAIQLDESNLKAGTLARSGSKRMKKKAKSEEELNSQKAWLDAEKVWVVHKAGFSGGRVQKTKVIKEEGETPMCKVKLDHGGEIITIEEDSIEKANPPQYDRSEDLATLRYLNESSCLHTLRQRFGSNLIHMYAGPNLIIINPQQQLAIYTEKVIQMFRGCKQEDMPPHIFASVQTAYRNMLATRMDQSIVFMGLSGSGKTTNSKHVMHYLTSAARSHHSALTDQKLEAIYVLLEAFGNVSTSLNHNASRFTLLFSMDFDSSGLLTGAAVQTFLLEKPKVVRQAEGESTFKIFQYLLAGCNSKLRSELQLDTKVIETNEFMLSFDPKSPENQILADKWTEIEFALQMLEISEEEAKGIWCILAAICHLGCAGISVGADNKPLFTNPAAVQRAAAILGTTQQDISEIIFAPPIVNQFTIRMRRSSLSKSTSSLSTSSSTDNTPEKQAKATIVQYIEALEGFAMGLYQEAFAALLRFINRSLQSNVRSVTSMHVLDPPGFQNPASVGKEDGALFDDLCHNYEHERLQKFFHDTVFATQMERYSQENIDCSFESVATTPDPVVAVFDRAAQGVTRGSTLDLRSEQKGLLWILDEESIFPGANDSSFLARLYVHHCNEKDSWVKQGSLKDTFYINHCQGSLPVLYNARGWLKVAREHATVKQAHPILAESSKSNLKEMFSRHRSAADGVTRSRSLKKTLNTSTAIKKNSHCLQLIYQVDTILDAIRKTKVNFVRCILPVDTAGHIDSSDTRLGNKTGDELSSLNVPLVRTQLRSAEMLDAIRIHRQGFPEHMPFGEFRRRFDILAGSQFRTTGPVLDEKKAVETLLENLELDQRSYRLGLSQIFFRAGTLAQLEDARDDKTTDTIVELQSVCRGFLARRKLKKLQVQCTAIRCIQKNIRCFLVVNNWPWWRLYTKVLPLLDVHRTEEELKNKSGEVDTLKSKLARLEREKKELEEANEKLTQKVTELSSSLSDERDTASHASEILEGETMERMRLERQLQELQESLEDVKKRKDKLEVELLEARALSVSATRTVDRLERYDGEGASEDEEEESFYRERYIQKSKEQDQLRKKLQNQAEEEIEELSNQKRTLERKLTEATAENDEMQRQSTNMKKKTARVQAEMEDLKLLLEEEQSRNAELEKKQRRFDSESQRLKEELNHEKAFKEKLNREKEKFSADNYRLDHELKETKEELEKAKKELERIEGDMDDITKQGLQGGDVVALKKSVRDLEQKVQDQEEELDDQAGQIQVLQQAKLRLEMAAEHAKHMVQKDLESKEEEFEQYRFNMQKKMKQLEDQLEDEHSEKTQAVKVKRETERRLEELRDHYERGGAETERKLKRELKKTKALLKDAHAVIESQSQKIPKERSQLKALKNQLEDAEFATQTALKGKKKLEEDVSDLQGQLDTVSKSKKELEVKYMTVLKENTELQSKVDEDEDDIETLTEKNRQLVKQLAEAQSTIRERETTIQEMSTQNESLESRVQHMSNRLSYLEESTVEKRQFEQMESKRRELATQLDMEGSFKKRQEVQVGRLKDQVQKLHDEREDFQLRETKLLQDNSRLDRQMRELREEMAVISKQEEDHKKRRVETEREVENLESVVSSLKQELATAKKRVSELQHALEDDMHYDTDGLSDDDDDVVALDLSDDDSEDDVDFKDNGSRPSEPRSYRSFDELEDEYDISDRLQLKLNDLTNSDVFENATSSIRTHDEETQVSRKSDRGRGSGPDDHDTGADKRRRKSEEKRRKSLEKKRSFEKRHTDNSIH